MNAANDIVKIALEVARKDRSISELQQQLLDYENHIGLLTHQLAALQEPSLECRLQDRFGLSKSESALLACLMLAKGRTLTRPYLKEILPTRDHAKDRVDGIVNVTIANIRKKIPRSIEAVRGLGWRINPRWRV